MALNKSFSKEANTCKVTFIVSKEAAQGAKTINLAGDFNCWSSTDTPLKQDADGNVSFVFMGGSTDILTPLAPSSTPEYYSLDGKYLGTDLNSLPKGVYIEKGKGVRIR